MNDNVNDLQLARNLFSKAQEVSVEFLDNEVNKSPFIILFFTAQERKQLREVLQLLRRDLKKEKLKLTVSENGGDFLSLSFLWESANVIFSCSPDRYNKRQLRDFRSYALYGSIVKLFFSVIQQGGEEIVNSFDGSKKVSFVEVIYHNYSH